MSSNKKATGKNKTVPPKCTCEDPYKCSCGNRPERPSKGHKWDPETQQWGGKGHKQKGASAQIATVGIAAKETTVGKTIIAQWQKLPTSLLEEFCKKDKRPCPTYSCNKKGNHMYQYQVMIQDAKSTKRGPEHDLRFIPVQAVPNEEQAQQEAALLALLHLTPNIPHELKLPEPYRSTWLHAIQSSSSIIDKNNNNNNSKPSSIPMETTLNKDSSSTTNSLTTIHSAGSGTHIHTNTTTHRPGAAQISTHLSQANTYISEADKRKKLEAQRLKRNEIIRKHEAIRLANRDHPVFMSARIRKQIEGILRESSSSLSSSSSASYIDLLQSIQDEEVHDNDDDLLLDTIDMDNTGTDLNYVKTYIVQRLVHEGFTKAQAITAFNATKDETRMDEEQNEERAWDKSYETCLQWLCIHLDEDQLPLGFDPRGGTLDVVLPSQGKSQRSGSSSSSVMTIPNNMNSIPIESIMSTYGTSREISQHLATVEQPDITFWDALCHITTMNDIRSEKMDQLWDILSQTEKDANIQATDEELETLAAIFADDMKISRFKKENADFMLISICLSTTVGETKKLVIQFRKGLYPSITPIVTIKGGWKGTTDSPLSISTHLELIKYLGQQVLGEPMIYSIYNFVLDIINQGNNGNNDEFSSEDAIAHFFDRGRCKPVSEDTSVEKNGPLDQDMDSKYILTKRTRPSSRNGFWNTPPDQIPPAVAFPKISTFLTTTRAALPAAKTRNEFLSKLKESRIVVLSGETGCGKSTQIPQFILEDSPKTAKIVVTQPRRLAAIGVGNRVAQERGEEKAGEGSVGYVVRGESAISNKCRLLFCTTGVLLRQLQNENALNCITHIVVDEVHERSLDCDVLLAILKEYLSNAPHLRVILMSATMDADRFASYWGSDTPRLFIPGFTYPVTDFTLEDVLSMTGYVPPKNNKNKNRMFSAYSWREKHVSRDTLESDNEPEQVDVVNGGNITAAEPTKALGIPVEELIKRVKEDDIDYNIIGILISHLIKNKAEDDDGSILVFLPGAPEINQAERAVLFYTKGLSIQVIQLHGGIQPNEQQRVFLTAPRGVSKIILSTNIAETSITIPDCTIVIDTCREKQSSFDPTNRMPILAERFSAKDSLRQRRGRAGRVRQGQCYKLISQKTLSELPDHSEPEIKRCALDQTILSLLFLGLDDGNGSFMLKMFDPPEEKAITSATFSLQKLGAVELLSKGHWKLTPLGMHLAGIPAPPCIGKLIVMGSLLGCRSFSLAMASGMSIGRSPIIKIDLDNSSKQNGQQSAESIVKEKILNERAKEYAQIGNSDLAFLAHLFLRWNESREKKIFCDIMGLSIAGMKEMKQLYQQLDDSLNAAGFYENEESNKNIKSWRLIRSCLVSALSPTQLVRVERGAAKYAETAGGSLEIEGPAKDLKFFIRGDQNTGMKTNQVAEERVFIHPSSMNFTVSSYSCPWLVYHELVRTSKAFLRDITECSAYALLLFGGEIKVEASNNLILVDGYVRLSAKARIGALIGGLRRKIDEILSQKITNPAFDISSSIEMKLIVHLIISDGL